jgi:hypothetical protein
MSFYSASGNKAPVSKEGIVFKTKVLGVENALLMPSKITLESNATSKWKQKK